MVTASRIMEIMQVYKSEHRNGKRPDPFIEGLILMRTRAGGLTEASAEFGASSEIFYGYQIDDLKDLTEEDVMSLNRFGWHFNDAYCRFAYYM